MRAKSKCALAVIFVATITTSQVQADDQRDAYGIGVGSDTRDGRYVEFSARPSLWNIKTTGELAKEDVRSRWLQLDLRHYSKYSSIRIENLEFASFERMIDSRSDLTQVPWELALRSEDAHICAYNADGKPCYRTLIRGGVGVARGFSNWPQVVRMLMLAELGTSKEYEDNIYAGPGLRIGWETEPYEAVSFNVSYEMMLRTQKTTFRVERATLMALNYQATANWQVNANFTLRDDFRDVTFGTKYLRQ